MNAIHHLRVPIVRLWRALLEEKIAAGLALPMEKHEQLLNLFERLAQKAGEKRDAVAIAEPSETESLLFQLWPQGLPHSEDLHSLAQAKGESIPWREVEEKVVGQSPAFRKALELALRIAPTNVPVTLLGETGVGKELFARTIHSTSPRNAGPFIAVNCGALPENLYATELFGYEPGSFTGAHRQGRLGRIEAASGGTLFLDEIGELIPAAQVALLRFLDSGEIQKVGRVKPVSVDARIVCASNCKLEELVSSGTFRQDLYYRLNLFPIEIPPLRERRDDIPLLASHFLNRAMIEHGTGILYRLSQEATRFLSEQEWPGNVRQLAFAVERAMLLARHEELTPTNFDFLRTESSGVSQDLTAQVAYHLQKVGGLPSGEIDKWANLLARQGYSGLSNRDIARTFDLSETAARDRLKSLCAKGLLIAKGEKRGRKYFLAPIEGSEVK